ncbi:MAG: hypothetical protein KGM24_03720, partial [Elusimicrobia bacterium]|nr:hypothetical protein [Elusimicrobiota bacterium]
MKSITPRAIQSIFCCSLLLTGASAPAFAQSVRLGLPEAAAGAPGAAAAAPSALTSPALAGGVLLGAAPAPLAA